MNIRNAHQLIVIIVLLLVYSCNTTENPGPAVKGYSKGADATVNQAFFDDFNYNTSSDAQLSANGWSVREGKGGPGPRGCSWSANNITFLADPNNASNKLLRLTSTTNGTARTTVQAEILTGMKFFEGTYAARVKFYDAPLSGTDGAQIVQTFFTISPYNSGDPLYSELDFEYLSNGGWGVSGPTLWNTSWNSTSSRTSSYSNQSYAGWDDLVMTVSAGEVKYYVNGVLMATHTGIYYPRRTMAIDFNQWFINSKNPASAYVEDVDWVYHAKNTVLSTSEVNSIVTGYRGQSVTFFDNM